MRRTNSGLVSPPFVPAVAGAVTGPDAYGAAAAVGVSTDYARSDHDHGLPAAIATTSAPRVYRKAIAFNSGAIATTGFAFYVPTIGDILMDVWFEITTPWNGTTPKGDVFTTGVLSLLRGARTPVTMTVASSLLGTIMLAATDATQQTLAGKDGFNGTGRYTMGRFTTADPLLVYVNQTGIPGGANSGATQGAGFINWIVTTPIVLP